MSMWGRGCDGYGRGCAGVRRGCELGGLWDSCDHRAARKAPHALHDTDIAYRMLVDGAQAGAMDDAVARLVPLVDGISQAVQTNLIITLPDIIGHGRTSFAAPFLN